jgi:ATP synthase subunit 6
MLFCVLSFELVCFGCFKSVFKLNKTQKLLRLALIYISGVLKNATGIKKHSFIVPLFSLFICILLSNIFGLLPYSITLTSHLLITIFFSLSFFIGNNLIGVCYHKMSYFCLFLPKGVPIFVIPFLILIEYISYLSRIFSLAIRLFANMMSGHILLKIMVSFIWAMLSSNAINWCWLLMPLGIVYVVIGLELAITFLQAYVFIVLISIYLNDAINIH